jgi:hypothetical protein
MGKGDNGYGAPAYGAFARFNGITAPPFPVAV